MLLGLVRYGRNREADMGGTGKRGTSTEKSGMEKDWGKRDDDGDFQVPPAQGSKVVFNTRIVWA